LKSLHELRAPSEDRGILQYPDPTLFASLIENNRLSFSNANTLIANKSIQDLRSLAKHETYSLAISFLAQNHQGMKVDNQRSLLVAGHQPELFHPGVWIKNFALNSIANSNGMTPLNLIIDNDVVKHESIAMPSFEKERRQTALHSLHFDHKSSGIPYEDWSVNDLEVFKKFGEEVKAQTAKWKHTPLVNEYWPEVLRALENGCKPGFAFAWARRKFEQQLGCFNLELPVSLLCETESFATFALHLFNNAESFAMVFNQAVAKYRATYGIKSKNHPFPDLAIAKGWAETPFWILLPGSTRRQRLGAKLEPNGEIRLGTPGPDGIRLNLGISHQLEELRKLGSQGFRIRPRALSTTLFARLILSDAFIHGIGGAKYDEVTNEMIQSFFNIQIPKFLVISATAQLQLIDNLISEAEVKGAKLFARDLWWNPQRHNPSQYSPLWHSLLDQRKKLLNQISITHLERKLRYEQLRNNLEQARLLIKPDYLNALKIAKRLAEEFKFQQQCEGREFSFILHSKKKLTELFSTFF